VRGKANIQCTKNREIENKFHSTGMKYNIRSMLQLNLIDLKIKACWDRFQDRPIVDSCRELKTFSKWKNLKRPIQTTYQIKKKPGKIQTILPLNWIESQKSPLRNKILRNSLTKIIP